MYKNERKDQLLLRAITAGVISERDRIFHYTIAEAYQEISLFIEETELKKAELDKLKEKK